MIKRHGTWFFAAGRVLVLAGILFSPALRAETVKVSVHCKFVDRAPVSLREDDGKSLIQLDAIRAADQRIFTSYEIYSTIIAKCAQINAKKTELLSQIQVSLITPEDLELSDSDDQDEFEWVSLKDEAAKPSRIYFPLYFEFSTDNRTELVDFPNFREAYLTQPPSDAGDAQVGQPSQAIDTLKAALSGKFVTLMVTTGLYVGATVYGSSLAMMAAEYAFPVVYGTLVGPVPPIYWPFAWTHYHVVRRHVMGYSYNNYGMVGTVAFTLGAVAYKGTSLALYSVYYITSSAYSAIVNRAPSNPPDGVSRENLSQANSATENLSLENI